MLDYFPKIAKDFPKLFRKPDERFRTFFEHFPGFSEDYRRRPCKIQRCVDLCVVSLKSGTQRVAILMPLI